MIVTSTIYDIIGTLILPDSNIYIGEADKDVHVDKLINLNPMPGGQINSYYGTSYNSYQIDCYAVDIFEAENMKEVVISGFHGLAGTYSGTPMIFNIESDSGCIKEDEYWRASINIGVKWVRD